MIPSKYLEEMGEVAADIRLARVIAIVVLVLIGCVLAPLFAQAAPVLFPTQYDEMIRKAQRRYLPDVDWRLLKAQVKQESNFRCDARSPVGAEGCAQFMPATWVEVSRALGYVGVPRTAAEPAFMGMAYYMAQLRMRWRSNRDEYKLALGGYNAGNGNIGRAARRAPGEGWSGVVRWLPEITGRHANETIIYVRNIVDRWFPMIVAGVR